MNFLKLIKQVFLFLLIILLGAQTTYAKTEFVLPQNQVSFSIEQSQSSKSLEKEVQPNIGFLKEKSKFGKSESISAQNQHEFSEIDVSNLANAGSGLFSNFPKVDNWIEGIVNATQKANIENVLKNWDATLLAKLDDVPNRNPNFFSQIESNPSILNHFEEGASIISNKSANLKSLELDMYALDKVRTTDIVFDGAGNYIKNPTRKSFDITSDGVTTKMNVNTQSGKISDANGNFMTTDNVNGEGLMYVIDEFDNIFIGGRNGMSLPHPTLIGGVNPNVKSAGMIRFKNGRILEISNNSGHFKPSSASLIEAETIFKQKLQLNSFDNQFSIVNVTN